MSKELTLIILTFNEEKNIEKTLLSVEGLAEHTLVWDSFSTDKTPSIVAQFPFCKLVQHKWNGWVEARNQAALYAQTDYVLFLDADEVPDSELYQAILAEKRKEFPHQSYLLNRLNHIGKRPIKSGAWYPDIKLRLYDKKCVQWKGGSVHEYAITSDSKSHMLPGMLNHYSFAHPSELWPKARKYAALASRDLENKGALILCFKLLVSPLSRFVRDYFIKKGFTAGYLGFAIANATAYEVGLKYKMALQHKLFGKQTRIG
jgi:glycosyltransferase involved in cell wall biosynthesis